MSTETITAVEPKRESLFSKKNRKLLTDPLDDSNPITVQVLGICSALAITVQVQQAVIMSLAVLFVMIGGNVIVSMMRNIIPDRIRIIVQLVVIASLVIIVDSYRISFPLTGKAKSCCWSTSSHKACSFRHRSSWS